MLAKRFLTKETKNREDVVKYLIEAGYPEPDEEQILSFLYPSKYPEQHWEAVFKKYDIFDFDRWLYLMDLLGYEISFDTAMTIITALWEEDVEIIECQPINNERIAIFRTIWDNNVQKDVPCTIDIFTHEVKQLHAVIDDTNVKQLIKERIVYDDKEYFVYPESDARLYDRTGTDMKEDILFWYKD